MDNFAYYLRACGGEDRYDVEPLVRSWSRTYDLVVRLTPDVELRADGVRSTNDRFRDEVEAILDAACRASCRATASSDSRPRTSPSRTTGGPWPSGSRPASASRSWPRA